MKEFFNRRMLPVFMAVLLMIPCFTVSASANFSDALTVLGNAFWDNITMAPWRNAIDAFFNGTSTDDHGPYLASTPWAAANYVLVTEASLDNVLIQYNTSVDAEYRVSKAECGDTGYYGLRFTFPHGGGRQCWLADGSGNALLAESGIDNNTIDKGHWEPFYKKDCQYQMTNYETLYNFARDNDAYLVQHKSFWVISHKDGDRGWFDINGFRWAAQYVEDSWATNQDRPATEVKDENGEDATDEDGNILQETVEGDNININMEGMTVTLPDGSINMIDQLIYDESTKTYYIDSHDTINNTINNYYSWTYHINYTSITYIGQTEEYNKYYEVYYELPDGRSSADLTAEELEQLNLTIDVIPYGRSADDTSLRSLYHFDGDTKDSSYWNYCTDFTWNKGASLTYMDAGVFDGALYLDENEHTFTITLPSNLGVGDFTLQFRYYQSHTEAPVTDSYVEVGGHALLRLDGVNLLNSNRVVMAKVPTGTWNEIAMVRKGNKFSYYLNGLSIRDTEWYSTANNLIKFHFGSEQQTYKYLDELRVLNRAIVTPGEPYTPTSVPHDTNLTLVLPDSVAPVADEYWEITHNTGTHLAEDYTDNAELTSGVVTGLDKMTTADGVAITPVEVANQATHITRYNNIVAGTSSISAAFKLLEYPLPAWGNGYYGVIATVSVNGKIYEVSGVVQGGGDYGFWYPSTNNEFACSDLTRIDNGIMGFAYDNLCIAVDPASAGFTLQAVDIVVSEKYSKLADAQAYIDTFANQFTAEKVSSIVGIEKAEMNTPTLAVRTDIAITNYQIGGVRPSVPYKGLVWALVEKGYITSIQIYNGQAWESVDGRIWTGERWIPYSSYNVITLQDMYDIVDATPNFEYIYTESGFWSWWQKSWNAFTERFFNVFGGGSGGGFVNPEIAPAVPDNEETGEKGYNVIDIFVVLKDGTWAFVTGIVSIAYDGFTGFVESVSSAGSFFDFYDAESEEGIFFIPLEEGETIWD